MIVVLRRHESRCALVATTVLFDREVGSELVKDFDGSHEKGRGK